MKANLGQHGIKFDERVLPRLNMTQLFYYDPDGIAVECNFPAARDPGALTVAPKSEYPPLPSREGVGGGAAMSFPIPQPAAPFHVP